MNWWSSLKVTSKSESPSGSNLGRSTSSWKGRRHEIGECPFILWTYLVPHARFGPPLLGDLGKPTEHQLGIERVGGRQIQHLGRLVRPEGLHDHLQGGRPPVEGPVVLRERRHHGYVRTYQHDEYRGFSEVPVPDLLQRRIQGRVLLHEVGKLVDHDDLRPRSDIMHHYSPHRPSPTRGTRTTANCHRRARHRVRCRRGSPSLGDGPLLAPQARCAMVLFDPHPLADLHLF